jgi:hypothetical protein
MSAGSLAKAISKSGSSYQQDIQDHQYSSSIRAPKSLYSKILSLFFAVMYGRSFV